MPTCADISRGKQPENRLECFRSFREAAKLQDCWSQIVELHCFGISGTVEQQQFYGIPFPKELKQKRGQRSGWQRNQPSNNIWAVNGSELFTSMSLQTPDKNTKNIENKDLSIKKKIKNNIKHNNQHTHIIKHMVPQNPPFYHGFPTGGYPRWNLLTHLRDETQQDPPLDAAGAHHDGPKRSTRGMAKFGGEKCPGSMGINGINGINTWWIMAKYIILWDRYG